MDAFWRKPVRAKNPEYHRKCSSGGLAKYMVSGINESEI